MSSDNRKVVKLTNHLDGSTAVDTLHRQQVQSVYCNLNRCAGSLMHPPAPQISSARSKEEISKLAKDFLRQYFESRNELNTPVAEARWKIVESEINENGHYDITEDELLFAGKTAWRNSQRCIARIQWQKLKVFDARSVNTAQEMFEALVRHIDYGGSTEGNPSTMTIFRHRTSSGKDFRIWNLQLIKYAGYKQEDGSIIGDPASIEFTEVCQRLGWKGKGGRFDILPIVVSAFGQGPELFEIPKEKVTEVMLKHPEYPKFAEMGLKWYTVPAVSNMIFDVGGIYFPACAFSGCYINTEIGRNLCDSNRYNIMEELASKVFDLDTNNVWTLWKDRVFLEVNKALLYSFQSNNVTMIDHHSASESFTKHLQNDQKSRGGCPADWIWIVPPLGGSLLSVFHQEMLDYRLTPSLSYQEDAWSGHIFKDSKRKRLFHLREIAIAAKFSVKLMLKVRAKRIRATIIYATETGKSEKYAKSLFDLFKYGFDVRVISADQYDCTQLDEEKLLLIVTSTFGNGDPPDSGKDFAAYLQQKLEWKKALRFAVFGLGSSVYPHFCTFAFQLDQYLKNLGGECILPIQTGDELNGQDQSFKKWAHEVFQTACNVFCLNDNVNMVDAKAVLSQSSTSWTKGRCRLSSTGDNVILEDVRTALSRTYHKDVQICTLKGRKDLQSKESPRRTFFVELEIPKEVSYEPGDHVAIFVENELETHVERLLDRLGVQASTKPVQVELMEETNNTDGTKTWKRSTRLPLLPLDVLLSLFLDITTPPSQTFLRCLSSLATNQDEKERLNQLSQSTEEYERWKRFSWPTLLEVLDEFPSIELDPTLLLVELPLLQPRLYSISSSPLVNPQQIDATVAVLSYPTKGGNGPVHHGVCSCFLRRVPLKQRIYFSIRRASTFHLPQKLTVPIYMIAAGTGIAPFRSFWQHFAKIREGKLNEITLIFGCRNSKHDHIYQEEIEDLQKKGAIKKFLLALSRQEGYSKTYVQNIIPTIGDVLFADITKRDAHVYVCGDVGMAAGVHDAIKDVLVARGLSEIQAAKLLQNLRHSNRYHEDIFGNFKASCGY